MRKLRKLSMVIVLTLALSASAFAGIIGTGPEAQQAPATSIDVTAIVLTLIQSLL